MTSQKVIRYVVSGWKDGDFFLSNFQLISIFSYAKSQIKKLIQIPELIPKNNTGSKYLIIPAHL